MKLKEISIKSEDLYKREKHGEPGFYLNTNETGKTVLFVSKYSIWFLGNYEEDKEVFDKYFKDDEPSFTGKTTTPDQLGTVSESFALKMLAVATQQNPNNIL